MQYTPVVVAPVAPALSEAFATVPDPRGARGKRFSLVAILNLAVVAILANHRSELAIAEWGATQSPAILRALGFVHGVTPHQTTLQRLFCALDCALLARALTTCFVGTEAAARGTQAVAVDGKALRGRLPFAPTHAAPIHLLTLYCQTTGAVLAQHEIACTGEKAQAELTVAPALLAQIDWTGRVLTGDALFCQRPLCAQVVAAGGITCSWSRKTSTPCATTLPPSLPPVPTLPCVPPACPHGTCVRPPPPRMVTGATSGIPCTQAPN